MNKMVEIINQKENKLLNRKEVEAYLEEKAPSLTRIELKNQLAKKLKVEENLIVIENIKTHYGKVGANVLAYVYADEVTLKKVTPEYLIKRNTAKVEEVEE